MTNMPDHLSNDEFEDLRKIFFSQAYEILEDLQDSVLKLESAPDDENILKAIQRHFHTLKGDSSSIGLSAISALCHRIEDVLTSLRDRTVHIDATIIALLLRSIDTVERNLRAAEAGKEADDTAGLLGMIGSCISPGQDVIQNPDSRAALTEYQELQIADAVQNGLNVYEMEAAFHPLCREKSVAALMLAGRLKEMGEILRILPEIDSRDMENTEGVSVLLSSASTAEDIKKATFIAGVTAGITVRVYSPVSGIQGSGKPGTGPSEDSSRNARSEMLRVEASKVDNLMNLVGELIISRSMIEQIARDMEGNSQMADTVARLLSANAFMERTVSDLQKGVMKMRMVPINHVFRRFPKIVRELSQEKGKPVRLEIFGRETELDKGIVDALWEPLSHIIRNSIDHGIEESGQRSAGGKPEEGLIVLRAYHEATQIVIEVSDDGKGIDRAKLRKMAVEKGVLAEEEAQRLSDADADRLIFLSGLSTSETVSETSGRGVGMDVVKSAVEAMKGSVEIESAPGNGTKFRLRLPLTLAIIKALLIEAGSRLYAIPIAMVNEVMRVMEDTLGSVDGKDTLLLRDRTLSLIRLHELFGTRGRGDRKSFALIVSAGGRKLGLLVDRIVGQQELVIKAIDEAYNRSRLIAGASILGDGRVVLILDASVIFQKAVEKEKKRMASA